MAMNSPGGPPGPPRGYWGYWNRPYSGCGCIWAIFVIVIIWWIIASFAYEPARFGWW